MAQKSKASQDKEDVSKLRTPIQLHGKTVEQILNGIHYGTPELRNLLLDECDIILECKVCRALFRDLPNFISHKRRYCCKSVTEDNHLAIARIPEEKVYVIQPQEPQSSRSEVSRKTKSKPSLEETISRIQSGELGHSHAFQVYTDAANKLQRQKEELKVATIRTSAISTNPNAVFVDVNMASVNIHERPSAASNNSSSKNTALDFSTLTRKSRERMNSSKNKNYSKKVRGRILQKDCKNSEELQKLLLKELKDIRQKVKQKAQGNDSHKHSSFKGTLSKVRNVHSERSNALAEKTVSAKEKISQLPESGTSVNANSIDSRSSNLTSIVNDKQEPKYSIVKPKKDKVPQVDLIVSPRSTKLRVKGSRSSDLALKVNEKQNVKNTNSKDKRSQSPDLGLALNDKKNLKISNSKRRSQSPELGLVLNNRKNLKTSNSKDRRSQTSDLGLIVNDKKSFRTVNSKDKGSQSSDSVPVVRDQQQCESIISEDKGSQSTHLDKQNSKSTIVKVETVAKVKELIPNMSVSASAEKTEMLAEIPDHQIGQMRKLPVTPPKTKYALRRKNLICPKCHAIFSSTQSLSYHKKIKHSPQRTFYPCLFCSSVFYHFYGVTRHLKLQHSKSNSEVNSLRKQLRVKAYTRILPELKDETDILERPAGLRKSLRNKQEAFSNQNSPDSSYVLHSVKKIGKKLSAKKDALDTPQAKEELKVSNPKNEKSRCRKNSDSSVSGLDKCDKSSNSSVSDLKTATIKNKIPSPAMKIPFDDVPEKSISSKDSITKSKLEKDSNTSLLSSHSFPLNQNHVHKCKKCRRLFGRLLTYKNHIKVCQGKVTALPHRRRRRKRGRGRKNSIVDGNGSSSAASTRSQSMQRSHQPTSVSNNGMDVTTTVKSKFQSKQITRSSNKDIFKAVNSIKEEDSKSESSRITDIESSSSKHLNSLLSTSGLNNVISSDNCEQMDPTQSMNNNESVEYQDTRTETEKKLTSEIEQPLLPKMVESDSPTNMSDNNDSMARQKTKAVSQRTYSQMPNYDTNPVKLPDEKEKDSSKDCHSLKNLKNIIDIAVPTTEVVIPKSSVLADDCREKKIYSVERDLRGKISHLVPRNSGQKSITSTKDAPNPESLLSISPVEERPKRKRKVPSRNIDAMEMLSKIHNPENEVPPMKKSYVCRELISSTSSKPSRGQSSPSLTTNKPSRGQPSPSLTSSKLSRGQPSPSSTSSKPSRGQLSLYKNQSNSIIKTETGLKADSRPKDKRTKEKKIKEGRITKSKSRIFVLGRKSPRGRKRLYAYDNARVNKLIDEENSKCLVCGETSSQMSNLRRHVIRIHLRWRRFQCKLCRFSSFDRSECTTHIARNHYKEVNIKDSRAVNSFITELAKQGSQAMNMKKNRTLQEKNKLQNKETNIYARPNVRKMPRLVQRTLTPERGEVNIPSSSEKQTPDNVRSTELNTKSLRFSSKKETMSREALDSSLRKNSLPFNISTRSSPRVFDTRPYKNSDISNTQEEIVVLHTRKGMYTKMVSPLPVKNNSDNEMKNSTSKYESKSTLENNDKEDEVKEKILPHIENSPSKRNIFDEMGFADTESNSDLTSNELKLNISQPVYKEMQEERTFKKNSQSCEENKMKIEDSTHNTQLSPGKPNQSSATLIHNSPGPNLTFSGSKSTYKCKELDSDTVDKEDNSQHLSKIKSPSISSPLSAVTVCLPNGSQAIKISPSHVVIESPRLPAPVHVGSSSVAKTLDFSDESLSTSVVIQPNTVSSATLSLAEDIGQSKSTLLDDIADETKTSHTPITCIVSSSSEEALKFPE